MRYPIRTDSPVKVRIYDGDKYKAETKIKSEYIYEAGRVWAFEVETWRHEAALNRMGLNDDELDPNQEYLLLFLDDGDTAILRNSFADIFQL